MANNSGNRQGDNMETRLRECPFCGGKADVMNYTQLESFAIFCKKCKSMTDSFNSENHAIKFWNTRPQSTTEKVKPEQPNNISPLPWKLGSLDRPWKEFIEACNEMSPDKEKYHPYCIQAENGEIVALFGPGPKSYDNAEFIMNKVQSLNQASQEDSDKLGDFINANWDLKNGSNRDERLRFIASAILKEYILIKKDK